METATMSCERKNHGRKDVVMAKKEALTVTRFINEVLVSQLSIPLRQIVNDTTFVSYTGSKRPDLLISEFEYDPARRNDTEFIENLVSYAEVKDDCVVGDSDWSDAIKQGKVKAPKLNLPYFIVTNGKISVFYNAKTCKEIRINNNLIREFQTIDILRLIKNKLTKNPCSQNIITSTDSRSIISEAIFNKKLWELEKIYRNISFDNNVQKIDFTIGFIALEYFEEMEEKSGVRRDMTKTSWSNCSDGTDNYPAEQIAGNLAQYIGRLEKESQFGEFVDFMENVKKAIVGEGTEPAKVGNDETRQIYNLINSLKPLHESGFDLFGAVYERFASSKEKKEFGQYFTRRHYTHILSKLLLDQEQYFDIDKKFSILDPACGTGGFLTEGFKILRDAYTKTETCNQQGKKFLESECFYGYDAIKDNISRTKLNMFLVGDGHTNMETVNTLTKDFKDKKWDYVITNPPYGAGNIKAETDALSSNRTEIAFLYRIMNLLKDGGKACVILPDGILENPSFSNLRKDFLEKCTIYAIVSLPIFAFAPYTKEKTYAVYFTKRNKTRLKIQKDPIWMYIIDNDGLANSDKRFHTKLRNNRNGWLHDEISSWVSTDGEEMSGILEERWLRFDDSSTNGTEWINEKGEMVKMRKGGHIQISKIMTETTYCILLPEYYLRPFEPKFITLDELSEELTSIQRQIKGICNF